MVLALQLAASASFTVVIGGDIMLNQVSARKNPLAGIASSLRKADVTIANLEIPLTRAPRSNPRKTPEMLRARDQYILKADPNHAQHLASSGIDVVSLANNHGMDYLLPGVNEMTGALKKSKIVFTGAGANLAAAQQPATFTLKNGVRIALISALSFMSDGGNNICYPATATSPGIHALKFGGDISAADEKRLSAWISKAKSKADFVFVALHWGLEKKTVPTPYQVSLGRAAIRSGADGVFGHHPHVLQGGEVYKGKPIFYSLGNLISPRPAMTAMFRLSFSGRRLTKVENVPVWIRGGSAETLSGKRRESEWSRFKSLSAQIQAKFRHKDSKPLPMK